MLRILSALFSFVAGTICSTSTCTTTERFLNSVTCKDLPTQICKVQLFTQTGKHTKTSQVPLTWLKQCNKTLSRNSSSAAQLTARRYFWSKKLQIPVLSYMTAVSRSCCSHWVFPFSIARGEIICKAGCDAHQLFLRINLESWYSPSPLQDGRHLMSIIYSLLHNIL